MTTEHPITPPPELVEQWANSSPLQHLDGWWAYELFIAHQAARWGADQELKACIEVILSYPGFESPELFVEVLREARRPKPPSFAEEALEQLSSIRTAFKIAYGGDLVDTFIRRALERLQELEKGNE